MTVAAFRLPAQFAHCRWYLAIFLLQCMVLPAACHTPLTSRKDAGAATGTRDQDAPAELPPPDLSVDALASRDLTTDISTSPNLPAFVPRAFRFVNHTAKTAYVPVDDPVGCRRQDGSGWQECRFFSQWCMLACGDEPTSGDCCVRCERLLPTLYAIAPGESRIVPWDGTTSTRATGTCARCECQTATPVPSGSFEAAAPVYADYQCSPTPSQPCQPIAGGIIDMAEPRGGFASVTARFTVPDSKDEVVLDITSLAGMDAGIELDAGPVDSDSVGDAITAVDSRPGEPAACQALKYSHFGSVSDVGHCPVDPRLPECASSDVGATVYRDEVCALATIDAHPDCAPWSRPQGSAFVFLTDPFGGCDWPITLDSVLDCGDHVKIEYSVTEPCQTCDAVHPSSVMLIIPDSTKPVRATASLVREEC